MKVVFVVFIVLVLAAMWVFSGPIFKHFTIEFGIVSLVLTTGRHLLRG